MLSVEGNPTLVYQQLDRPILRLVVHFLDQVEDHPGPLTHLHHIDATQIPFVDDLAVLAQSIHGRRKIQRNFGRGRDRKAGRQLGQRLARNVT